MRSKGQEFLKAIGHKSTTVLSLEETRLDERYMLVRASFNWRFDKAAEAIDVKVDSTFILQSDQGALKIVFQHEHEDFQQALRASGLLPPKP